MDFTLDQWTRAKYDALVCHLIELADDTYKNFHQKLIPDITNLLGIRMPKLQALAKEIAKGNFKEYLDLTQSTYYEEVMLKGLVIGSCKADVEEVLSYLVEFVPSINNWAICDCVCASLKITKKHKERVFVFLKDYLLSSREFELRFAIVMQMDFFIEDEYIDRILYIFDGIKHEGYYVKMAIAWALSVCYVKQEEKTMAYLKQNNLDDFTYNKALQKIIESNRVTKEQKDQIRLMKRKKK